MDEQSSKYSSFDNRETSSRRIYSLINEEDEEVSFSGMFEIRNEEEVLTIYIFRDLTSKRPMEESSKTLQLIKKIVVRRSNKILCNINEDLVPIK